MLCYIILYARKKELEFFSAHAEKWIEFFPHQHRAVGRAYCTLLVVDEGVSDSVPTTYVFFFSCATSEGIHRLVWLALPPGDGDGALMRSVPCQQ